jgi:mannose-1-phosphate guanylyltransferase
LIADFVAEDREMWCTEGRWRTHNDAGHNWALVLAGGNGSRLQALTMTASGVAVPKQFCSLGNGPSLLEDTLHRAQAIAPPQRTCVVLAEQHRRWWRGLPLNLPAQNLIAQPRNRGTANGILLPLLHIVHRDPDAAVLVLPSDHYVRNETVLAVSLRRAMHEIDREPGHLILLGMTPEDMDPEFGYIIAEGDDTSAIRAVSEFVEKPSVATARELMARGGVWNSFIFAAHSQGLIRAFEARCPDLVGEMQHIVGSPVDADERRLRLVELYERLPDLDFSRDILERSAASLRVLTVPACGWTDLGTPRRVAATVGQCGSLRSSSPSVVTGASAFVDLAERHLQSIATA